MADGSAIITRVRLIFDGGAIAGPFDTPDPDQTYTFDLVPPVVSRRMQVEAVETTGDRVTEAGASVASRSEELETRMVSRFARMVVFDFMFCLLIGGLLPGRGGAVGTRAPLRWRFPDTVEHIQATWLCCAVPDHG